MSQAYLYGGGIKDSKGNPVFGARLDEEDVENIIKGAEKVGEFAKKVAESAVVQEGAEIVRKAVKKGLGLDDED